MDPKKILEQIEQERAMYNTIFNMYINTDDIETQQTFRRKLIAQMKSIDESIKMYRKARESELDEEHDKKYADYKGIARD